MFVKNGKNYIKKMFVKKWKKPKNGKKLVVIGLLKNGKIVKNKTKTKKCLLKMGKTIKKCLLKNGKNQKMVKN